MQQWFEEYPQAEQAELRTRLRIETKFREAWFELFLHALASRLGASAITHPPLAHTTKAPDFGLADANGDISEYLEARVVRGESVDDRGRQAVINTVYDAINQLENPDFLITIPRLRLVSGRQPSGKLIRKYLQAELSRLDPDRDQLYSPADYRDKDVEIEFRILARAPERRGTPGRLLGGYSGGARWGGAMREIKNAVRDKAGRYGKLGKPFVIALDVASVWFNWHEDTCDALYGKDCWTEGATYAGDKTGEGIFHGCASGYSRVSAVLVTDAAPWHVSDARIRLYHNPYAQHPYEGVLYRLPQARFDDRRLTSIEGLSLSELFGLTKRLPYEAS